MSDARLNLVVQFSPLDKLSGALKNIIGLGKSGDQALRGMKREARDLNGQLKAVQAAMAKGTGNVTALIDKERELAAAIAKTNTAIERQKRLNTIDGTVNRVKARGAAMQATGRDNLVGGAVMAAPLVLAGKAAMDFSSGMVDIQLKANLTNAETTKMANNIMLLARQAKQLPEDMRAGVDVLSGFGLDPRLAVQMIGPIGRLGTAYKVDIADAASAANANLQNLKLPLAQTARGLDIMAAAGNAGAFEVRDMAKHFPALTGQMQALGQSGTGAVADLSAALQIARKTTGDSDTAANNIKNLLAKINSPGVIRAFQKNFGVDLPAALKRAYAQGKTPMEAMAEITKKATGGDLSKLGFAVEDMQAQDALRTLINNMDEYRKIREDIGKSSGAVDQAFNLRLSRDAAVRWQDLKGRGQALAITMGTRLLPVAERFADVLIPLADRVSNFAAAHPTLTGNLAAAAAGLVAMRMGLGALQYTFGSVIGPMATVWGWWQKYKAVQTIAGVFPRAARMFGVLRTAAIFLGQGFMRAGMMMLANPMVLFITAIVVAVGLLGYAVYRNWDRIKAAFGAGWAWIQAKWQALSAWWHSLPGAMRNIGSAMMQGLLMALNPAILAARLLSMARTGIAAFKAYFGIKSPSRLFMAMGGHMTAGLGIGIERGGRHPLRAMGRLAAGVAGAGALAAGPAMASPRASAAAQPRASAAPITINVYQREGEDGEALAQRIAAIIERNNRRPRGGGFADDF